MRRVISSLSCCTLETCGCVDVAATVGGMATSMILSAMSASLGRSVVASAEARTIRTLAGRRCRKSSFRNALSVVGPRWSPSSCCIRRRSWVGFLSPSSSPLISCWSLRCSEAAVRFISSALRVSYGRSAGGRISRSLTSQAISGDREEIT